MIKKFCEFIKEGWTSTTTNDVTPNEQEVIKLLKVVANWDDSRDDRKLKAVFGSAKGMVITGNTSKYSPIINRILGGVSIFVNHSIAANSKQLIQFANKYRNEILVFDDAPIFIGDESAEQTKAIKELLDNSKGFVIINTDSSYKELKKLGVTSLLHVV